ncbi:MAG: helix-turn-helix transcriptional regulator [Lachnospiraceae bacterium]|nr:helix-turn-helix transcriptional regulator [Lachnospiraceae bacterium]
MGRKSIKENKNIYQIAREEQNLTRAQASEKLVFISEAKIEKIESEAAKPQPEDVVAMSKAYLRPDLCNYYCANECPIGQKNVAPVNYKDLSLSNITLEVLSSLNFLNNNKDRLVDITVDGKISEAELHDFAGIYKELTDISNTAQALKIWIEQQANENRIDLNALNEHLSK